MCVLTVKEDKQLMPLRAKSRIVVLGNRKCRDWSKSDRFAPVLWFDGLRFLVSLAAQRCRGLKQGNCKNAFCQGILPPDEITIVCPPSGDPDAHKDEYWLFQKTLYGLRHSPHYCFECIDSILCSIGLTPNPHDSWIYTRFVCDPSNISTAPSTVLYHWVSMLMTLSTSQWILWWSVSLNVSCKSVSKLTLWDWLNGS
jgi:hypothetical protein